MPYEPLVLSVLSILVSVTALVITLRRKNPDVSELLARQGAIEKDYGLVRQAFEKLERDTEEQWEKVNKGLGRIGRLKYLTDAAKLATETSHGAAVEAGGDNAKVTAAASVNLDDLHTTSRADLLRIARERGILGRVQ